MFKKSTRKPANTQTDCHQIGHIIRHLMQEVGITEAELARQTQLPQTTINRLLLGETTDPRANTLKPLANFFCVSVDQLLGTQPLDATRIPGTFKAYNRAAWQHIPIIGWEDALAWQFTQERLDLNNHQQWIAIERPVADNAFVLLAQAFMEPRFKSNSLLIIDPSCPQQHGKFVIVSLDNQHVTARQLSCDNNAMYLKHFDKTIPSILFDQQQHRILGTIVEARIKL